MLSEPGCQPSDGITSSPSHFVFHGSPTWPYPPYEKSEKSSGGLIRVVSSLGRSYTLIELCICMDYWKPVEGQLAFLDGNFGRTYTKDSEDPKCVVCNRVRPSRFMSVSML